MSGLFLSVRSAAIFCSLCLLLCSTVYCQTINDGAGSFAFDYKTGDEVKPVTVYYYCPADLAETSRIVFVMHGDSRSGLLYLKEWAQYAEKENFLLLCPELPKDQFDYWAYNCGNIYDSQKKSFNPKEQWTFNLIEQLFDFAVADREMLTRCYCIFGHSSGAQFVHRMVIFMPEGRFSLAIANGAGWYTLSDFDRPFYSGLKNTAVTDDQLKKAFAKNLIILMGEKDFFTQTRPDTYDETTHKWDRLYRAEFFFQTAKENSKQLSADFNWLYRTVPNADHNNPRHAIWATRYIVKSPKTLRKTARK